MRKNSTLGVRPLRNSPTLKWLNTTQAETIAGHPMGRKPELRAIKPALTEEIYRLL